MRLFKSKINIFLALLFSAAFLQSKSQNNRIHLTGEFPAREGARVFIFSQHIDTFLVNGKFDIFLDNIKEGEQPIAIIYPNPEGVWAFRDKDGIVKTHKYKPMRITLFTEFYINPSQSTYYHFTPVSKITTDMLDNYSYDTDNYRSNIFGINVSSGAKDTKLYDEFEKLTENFKGEMTLKILDSLFKTSTKPDKIYPDFDSTARKLNYQQNFNKYFASFTSIVRKNLNNPISALAMLNLSKRDFDSKKEELGKLLHAMGKIDKRNDYYSRALLRLKEIDDPLMVGKYFFKPTGKTPDLKDCKFNASSSKYTLIEFWASWCKPCRENNPGWNSILDKYQNKGFQILGISLDDNLYRWKKAIEEDKLGKWTHVSDLAGGFNGYNGLKYKIEVIPFNVLIDSTGKIIYRDVKPSVLSKLLDSIDNHLQ